MASYRIQSVEKFNFGKPEEWPRWIKRFERFRQVSDLTSKSGETQVSTLVYSMGDKAEDILESFGLSEGDAKKYDTVKAKFEDYFVKKKNPIFERAKFNKRRQGEQETVDDFITDLYQLAANCEYGNLHDELIRDRIVVGIKDSELSEKLQMEATLTLEQAVTSARQSEAVKKQQKVVRGDQETPSTSVDRLITRKKPYGGQFKNSQHKQQSCTRCGISPSHSRQNCPAREATCHKCNGKGHYKRCCRTKRVRGIEERQSASDSETAEFMGSVTADAIESNHPWNVSLCLDGRELIFKIDTGADVTVIPESEYLEERDGKLKSAQFPLRGPSGKSLDVHGKFQGQLSNPKTQQETKQDVYVIRNLKRPLLGRPAQLRLSR